MTEQSLAIVQKHSIISNFDDLARAANAMSKSGYFQDSRDQAQAIVKIMAGQEMGFGAFASMTGIHIIQGKPTIGANLMASAVKGSGKYDYRIIQLTDTVAEVEFFQSGKSIGISKFTIEDAKKANLTGKGNWQTFPRNMLFSRAMSNGVRWYCPDVFNGASVYTPEELGAEVNADGDVITGAWKEAEPEEQPVTPPSNNGHKDNAPTEKKPERPYEPEILKAGIAKKVANLGTFNASDKQIGLLASMLDKCFAGETNSSDLRHAVQEYLTGYKSSKEMPGAYVKVLLDWLDAKQDNGGDYSPSAMAVKEAQAIRRQSLIDAGQMDLLAEAEKLGGMVTA
jgi:hypothetical protein